MHQETGLIVTLAAGLGLAFVLGLAATRLRLPPLVGYLLAGVVVGPFTPGYVAHAGIAQQLAEVGVILLMFGVGIHFSVGDLLAVRRIALPGALAQIGVATVLGAGMARLWGWSWGAGIVFGLCLSVASTVVLLRALEDRGMLDSVDGRIAVGWLVVEDLVTVLVLVLLPALALPLGGTLDAAHAPADASGGWFPTVALTLAKVAAFVAIMFVVGRRVVPWLLERVARTGSRELFTLAVLAVALGVAVGASALFGVSFALGAFIAGMVVNGSDLSGRAASNALPLQDAFSVLFFVAVGMLFDPTILLRQPLEVLAVVAIVVLGKSIAAFLIVIAFRHPVHTALTISASLAQIGEFSFILAALGVSLGLMPAEGQSLVVAGALLSIGVNALAFVGADALSRAIVAQPRLLALLEGPPEPSVVVADAAGEEPVFEPPAGGHVVIVGYGRVGGTVGEALARQEIPFVAVEEDRETFEQLRDQGLPVIHGDGSRASVLERANVAGAMLLVVAAPDPFQARAIIEVAREANPAIDTVVRTHTDAELEYLVDHGVGLAVMGERELANTMARYALARAGSAGAPAVPVTREAEGTV
jgi:monovalent cation:H+ antiporter-2, CPA2 family